VKLNPSPVRVHPSINNYACMHYLIVQRPCMPCRSTAHFACQTNCTNSMHGQVNRGCT
jgi:hypothetical protein